MRATPDYEKDYGFDPYQLKKILKEQKYRLCSKTDLNDVSVNNYAFKSPNKNLDTGSCPNFFGGKYQHVVSQYVIVYA